MLIIPGQDKEEAGFQYHYRGTAPGLSLVLLKMPDQTFRCLSGSLDKRRLILVLKSPE